MLESLVELGSGVSRAASLRARRAQLPRPARCPPSTGLCFRLIKSRVFHAPPTLSCVPSAPRRRSRVSCSSPDLAFKSSHGCGTSTAILALTTQTSQRPHRGDYRRGRAGCCGVARASAGRRVRGGQRGRTAASDFDPTDSRRRLGAVAVAPKGGGCSGALVKVRTSGLSAYVRVNSRVSIAVCERGA